MKNWCLLWNRTPAPSKAYNQKVEKSEQKPKKSILKPISDIKRNIHESASDAKLEPSTINVLANKTKAENLQPVKKLHTEARIEHYRTIRDKGYLTSGLMGNQKDLVTTNLSKISESVHKQELLPQKKVDFKSTAYIDDVANAPTQVSFLPKSISNSGVKNAKNSRQTGNIAKSKSVTLIDVPKDRELVRK